MKKKKMKTPYSSRRQFIKRTAITSGAALGFPLVVPNSLFGANAPSNRITIGCIGVGNMGSGNMRGFYGKKDAQVVALAEVDSERLEKARQTVSLPASSSYSDFRELIARKDIDAVVVCTPDHWHMPASIAAIHAGKDVYCEKPLTHTISEGRRLVNEAKRYSRIVQTGSQQRSSSYFLKACELVRNGRIGKVHTIHVGIPGNNRQCEPTWQAQPIPETLNYDMWLGPAAWAPYHEQRCHYQFRFILDYSGGQVTNWGAHHLDIAQWGLGMDQSGPVTIKGDGEFPHSGLFTTATRVFFEATYANGTKLICKTGAEGGTRFEGTEGWVHVNRGRLDTYPATLKDSVISPDEIHLYRSTDHKQNFLDCIRSRQEPITCAEVGHRSSTVCHLGNIAMQLNRTLKWDPQEERFVGDSVANRMLWRPPRATWTV
jgi:predicted dehydrogenase